MSEWSQRQWWLILGCLSLLLLAIDYFTGPFIRFPITFVGPVVAAGWFLGRWPAVAFSLVLVATRYTLVLNWGLPDIGVGVGLINALIYLAVLVTLAYFADLAGSQHRELSRRLKKLEGLLPICSFCKKIRRADGKWESVEVYVTSHSEAHFSHGFCEECARKNYPEVFGNNGGTSP